MDSSLEVRNCTKYALLDIILYVVDKSKMKAILLRTKDENSVNKILTALDQFNSKFSGGGGGQNKQTTSIYGKSMNSLLSKTTRSNMNKTSMQTFQNNNFDQDNPYEDNDNDD